MGRNGWYWWGCKWNKCIDRGIERVRLISFHFIWNEHMNNYVSFFASCVKVYVFETRKARNGWYYNIYKNLSGCEGKILSRNFNLADIDYKYFWINFCIFFRFSTLFIYFPIKTYILLANEGFAPPPLADIYEYSKNVSFFWKGYINLINTQRLYFCIFIENK